MTEKKCTALQLMMEYMVQQKYWISDEFKNMYEELIEREKFQIKTAFHMGEFNIINADENYDDLQFENGEHYYNFTYQI